MDRLYDNDPYLTVFTASVLETRETAAGRAVRLDRTAFHPAGGGQPDDRGEIAGVAVMAVEEGYNGEIWHTLAGPAPAGPVEARVDWTRRFDLMQQHSGQHVLSAAFVRETGSRTVGFHLTGDNLQIDLDRPLDLSTLTPVEGLANRVIWEDRPVVCRFLQPGEAEQVAWRKTPERQGPVRMVVIDDFDASPCSGTHVRRTGEIGLLKIVAVQRAHGGTRIGFACGGRALRDYGAKHEIAEGLACEFSVSPVDLPPVIKRLKERLAQAERDLEEAREALLQAEALGYTAGGGKSVVKIFAGRPLPELRALAGKLTSLGAVAVLATAAGDASQIVLVRPTGEGPDLAAILRRVLAVYGGKGGGTAVLAQGGVGSAFIAEVMKQLQQELGD